MDSSSLFVDDTIVADRSTLERWQECPRSAAYLAHGGFNDRSFEAESGTAVHDVLSAVTGIYVDSKGALNTHDLLEEAKSEMLRSRPDLQPDVIKALRPALWTWCSYLNDLHYENVLRFDGGKGDRSGQLAHDFEHLGIRVTSEIDLLHATASTEVVEEIDYKSGHTPYTAETVRDSFQFQMHGMLILQNYPEVKCVRISVWCPRVNRKTYRVDFARDRLHEYEHRVHEAAKLMHRWREINPASVPAHPMHDRCILCPASLKCADAGANVQDIAKDPHAMVDRLVQLEASADSLRKSLGLIVDASGDILTANGNAFGTGKPKQNRKPVKGTWSTKSKATEEEAAE